LDFNDGCYNKSLMERRLRNVLLEKENEHKNANKKDYELEKMDRLLKIKKISSLEDREIKGLRNTRETRAVSKSFGVGVMRHELKPISEQPNNTQQYCQLYAADILEHSQLDTQILGSFLATHDIDRGLRARMLDWMIEVTSSYKFSTKTYFTGVQLMDRYFQA
jgi:hypothetical protein